MDFPARLLAGFLALIVAVLLPLPYIAQSTNENVNYFIEEYTQKLADNIRKKGYINKSMYEDYMKSLDSSGELYDLEIEDIHPVTGEKFKETSRENMKRNMITAKVKAKNTNFSIRSTNINTKNQIKAINLSAVLNHNHTDACFAKVKHIHLSSCYGTGICSGHLSYCYTFSTLDLGGNIITRSIYVCDKCQGVFADPLSMTCTAPVYDVLICGKAEGEYYSSEKHIHTGSPETGGGCYAIANTVDTVCGCKNFTTTTINPVPSVSITLYVCTQCYYQYSSKPESCSNIIKKKLYSLACGKTEGCYYDNNGNLCTPICDQVVTSVTATNPNQTVCQGDSVISTAIATMLDGSTKTVNCSVSGYDSNKLDTPQNVTLNYYGLVNTANTMGTKICTLAVIVKSRKVFSSISVTPTEQIINRLSTPSFAVTAIYNDGSRKSISGSEYSMYSFDSTKAGPQTVVFTYTESGITKTAKATVCVDVLTDITVTPKELTAERYTKVQDIPLSVTASYLYSSNKTVTGYTISDYNPSLLGLQKIRVSYTESGITKSEIVNVTVSVLHRTCPRCNNTYDLNTDDSDPGCPYCRRLVTGISVTPDQIQITQGDSLPVTVQAVYADGFSEKVYGWSSNYDSSKIGPQMVTVEYGGYIAEISVWVNEAKIKCAICKNEYPASQSRCPVCASTVESITVSPDHVTVNQYENINLTVTAHYVDGSSKAVTGWSIDCSSSKAGTFTASVIYLNVTATITVTVISMTAIVCPICGRVYEPADNPRGCPICSNTLTGIEAYLSGGSNLVQYGTIPDISVILIYLDQHREITTEGYLLNNFNPNMLGKQTIIVHYGKYEYSLEIEVVNILSSVTCPNGHVYYRNEDGSDPGCPYCAMAENLNTVYYFDITYLNEILDKVYTDGIYYFVSGNYITINITKRDVSLLTRLQNTFFKTSIIGRKRKYTFGGEVIIDG